MRPGAGSSALPTLATDNDPYIQDKLLYASEAQGSSPSPKEPGTSLPANRAKTPDDLLPNWWLNPRRRLLYNQIYKRRPKSDLGEESGQELQILDSRSRARGDKAAALANTGMDWLFVGGNAVAVSVAAVALATGNVTAAVQILQLGTGMFWNYGDGVGGIANAVNQIQYKEYFPATVNIVASTQLIVLTTLSGLITMGKLAWGAGAAAGLAGFAFAACMFTSCLIEVNEIRKCDKNIQKLKKEIQTLTRDPSRQGMSTSAPSGKGPDSPKARKFDGLEKALALEKAKRKDHIRNAKSWLASGVIMTAIATVGFIAASGATAGVLPAILLAVAVLGFAVGCIRKHWANRINHVQRLKEKQGYIDEGFDFDSKIKTLQESKKIDEEKSKKLERLVEHHPEKAEAVIKLLEEVPEAGKNPRAHQQEVNTDIEEKLNGHQNWYGRLFGATASSKIWNQRPGVEMSSALPALIRL